MVSILSFLSLTFLLSLCTSTISRSLRLLPIVRNNSTSIPNLRGPPTPPGFDLRLVLDLGQSFDSDRFYLSAIETMYRLAQADWDQVVTREVQKGWVVGVRYSYHTLPDQPKKVTVGHVVVALLGTLENMDSRSDFSTGVVEMRNYGRDFGILEIEKRGSWGVEGVEGGGGVVDDDLRVPHLRAVGNTTTTVNGTTGTSDLSYAKSIIDPDDPDLVIGYERFGSNFACKEIFGAGLDALAVLAQEEDNTEKIEIFTGMNWSEKVVYQAFSDRQYGELLLSVDVIKRVMRLVPERVWEDGVCGEVRFLVSYRGVDLGRGRFWVKDFEKEGGGGAVE
ncbi:MAG: hypothetical protein Q9178_003847 [Gyalolechia marmorata]